MKTTDFVLTTLFLSLAVAPLAGCSGRLDAGTDPQVDAGGAAPAAAAPDYSIEPTTDDEARKQCETPPTEWESTPSPVFSDYAPHRWVMCKPAWVITFLASNQTIVDGLPYQTFSWWLVAPANQMMQVVFPIDEFDDGTGYARGLPERARGGLTHWLRLSVDPLDSGSEARKLNGQTQAIFVRVKTP